MNYILNNTDSLEKLRCEKNLKNSIRKIKLVMDDSFKAKTLEHKLNKYYFACGCQTGMIAVYVVLFSSFLFWWSTGFTLYFRWWHFVIILAVAAFAGKLTGLLISRYRLKKLFRTLSMYYANSPVSVVEP